MIDEQLLGERSTVACEPSLIEVVRRAWRAHRKDAELAFDIFASYCEGHPPPRVPGMDTVLRLAHRIYYGHTAEQSAAREYVYRWELAFQSKMFGAPHLLGA